MYSLQDFLIDLKRAPFVKIIIPLILGIICENIFLLPFPAIYIVITFFAILVTLKFYKTYRYNWVYGVFFYSALFFSGISLLQTQPQQSCLPLGEKVYFRIAITGNPIETANAVKLDIKITAFSEDGEEWQQCNEKSTAYMQKNARLKPSLGDVIVCETKFNEIESPKNPGEFNYKEYLKRKRIFSNTFINPKTAIIADNGQIAFYKKTIYKIQEYAYQSLQKAGLGTNELSVAMALLLGNRQYIDDDLEQSYISSGSIHILAVSGLHVGIIFLILNFLLSFMNRSKATKYLKGCIILVSLFIYAAIAGFAPSISRAVIMFSVLVITDMFGKMRNTYNNMALSALVLCFFNPYIIYDVGFQLSYAAVLGIVYFQPKFMQPFYKYNKLVRVIMGCVTVSLAAQLGVLPIILYTFKSFPVYFLLTNLVLVPVIPIIMYIGIAVIAVSWQPALLALGGYALNFCIAAMNSVVQFIENLPYSVINGIYFNGFQCCLLFITIICLALLFSLKKAWFAKVVLISLIGIFSIRAVHLFQVSTQKEFGVFNVRKAFYAYFITGDKGFKILDPPDKSFDFNTKNYLIEKGFKSEKDLTTYSLNDTIPGLYNGVLLFAGNKIGLSSQLKVNENFTGTPLNIDFLYITAQSPNKPSDVFLCYLPSKIIFANNLSARTYNEWLKEVEARKIDIN